MMLGRFRGLFGRASAESKFQQKLRRIDDEFRLHIESKVDDLVAEGWDRSDAEAEAQRCFGDPSGYRAEILNGEVGSSGRFSGIAAAGFLLLLAGGGVVSYGFAQALQQSRSQIEQLTMQVQELRGSVSQARQNDRIPMAQDVRFVTVDGAVEQPLVWTFGRRDDITLEAILERSGGLAPDATGQVYVVRFENGGPASTTSYDFADGARPAEGDPTLDGTYFIYAEKEGERAGLPALPEIVKSLASTASLKQKGS